MAEKTRGPLRVLSLLSGVALLSSCSVLPPLGNTPERERLWLAQQHSLDQLHTWTIAGRLAIQTEHEGWHVSFRWRQEVEIYDIALSAPLGQESAELQGDSQGVTLLLADGRREVAVEPEALLLQRLGWRVPIKGLHYWVRGLPVPDAVEVHSLDEDGRLQWLEQSGWRISYRRYGDSAGKVLPTKIFLENGGLKMRLVIDEWTLP